MSILSIHQLGGTACSGYCYLYNIDRELNLLETAYTKAYCCLFTKSVSILPDDAPSKFAVRTSTSPFSCGLLPHHRPDVPYQ